MSIMFLLVNVLLYFLVLLYRKFLVFFREIRELIFNKKDLNFVGYIEWELIWLI